MKSQPPILPRHLPVAGTASMRAQVVLRDVAVRGQVSLPRPRVSIPETATNEPGRTDVPNVVPVQAMRQMASSGTASAQESIPIDPAHFPIETRGNAEALRKGFEEGLAQGLAQAAEQARQAEAHAEQRLQKKLRELESHVEKQAQEHRQQDQATLQSRLQRIDSLLAALSPQVQARIDAAEDDMLALCFESVCRILGTNAATPERIREQVIQAREVMRGRPLVAVHLHPDDLVLLRSASSGSDAALASADNGPVTWIADPAVTLGGCILQSSQGGLDARFDTQLRALAQLLAQARASAHAAEPSEGR